MGGDGGSAALAFAGDGECIQFVDTGGEVELARGGGAIGNGDRGAARIEAEISDDYFLGAGGKRGQDVAAGGIGEGAEAERGDGDLRALEEIAGGDVGNVAGEGGGLEGGEGEKERGGEKVKVKVKVNGGDSGGMRGEFSWIKGGGGFWGRRVGNRRSVSRSGR